MLATPVLAFVALCSHVSKTRVILYHKSAGVVTTHAEADVLGRPNVYQEVAASAKTSHQNMSSEFAEQTWHAVGRLDADTTGLLLLTNDGGLVHHVTTNKTISKTYEAVIMGHHENTADIFETIRREGVDIGQKYGGRTLPVPDLRVIDHPSRTSTTVSLSLREGKNRQVRRMFHAVGSGVMRLRRTHIGCGLTLTSVPNPGMWRFLTDEEIFDYLGWICRPVAHVPQVKSVRGRRRNYKH